MPSSVTKAVLIQHLSTVLGVNKREAQDVVNIFFHEITEALARHETIKLPGFGVFTPKHKTSREGRNPKTGEIVRIEERRVATFKAAPLLKMNMIHAHSKQTQKTVK
jgi:integration host factor subunit alpha